LAGSITEDEKYDEQVKKRYIHPIVGRIWYSLLYLFATGATFAAALGCWSPATQMFSLFNTDSSQMISYLANATGFNDTQFQHPDLPDSWSWGFSGTCQLYIDTSKDTKCYHAFPPLFTIQDLIEKALANSNKSETAATISTWNTALTAKPSNPAYSALANSESRQTRSVSFFRGAAAAMVFSLLISFNNCFSSISLFFLSVDAKSDRKYRHALFGIAIFDFLLYAAAIVCFSFAMTIGPAALVSGSSLRDGVQNGAIGEVGYIVMLAALTFRLMSVPIIGFVIVCILGFELILIVGFAYLLLKGMLHFMYRLDDSNGL
ncbi:hypothetical protein N431DRAFT_321774, partial [Stipitochalara longipes BDJ]